MLRRPNHQQRTIPAPLLLVTLAVGVALSLSPALANHGQFYVLDGFGGVHAGGGAPVISPGTPYFGFDIAKDIVYVPGGIGGAADDGVLVLDGFGGVHEGGALFGDPVSPKTPYFGFNIARAIAYRNVPPRSNFTSTDTNNTEVTSSSNVIVASTTLTAPDDGFVVILGNLSMGNNSPTTGAVAEARICVSVDGTTCLGSIDRSVHMEPFADATSFSSQAVTQGTFVGAGAHTFNLLVRKAQGSGQVVYFDPTVTVVFIDQDAVGSSSPARASAAGPTGPPIGR